MRYSQQDKRQYMFICGEYNRARRGIDQDPANFVALSVTLHSMKGRVPQKMRRTGFVEAVGV